MINEALESTGFFVHKGTIELLEIRIPLDNILSGQISVLIQGLYVSIRPSDEAQDSWDQNLEQVEQVLATSIADVTQSFLLEEIQDNVGITEDLPEPMMLQRMLDTIITGLSIDINRLSVDVADFSGRSAALLDVATLAYVPHTGTFKKAVRIGKLQLYLLCQAGRSQSSIQPDRIPERSVSSRSTSSSSYNDAELMQSTIFDLELSRSIYMSALSSPSAAESSSAEETCPNLESTSAIKAKIFECNAGLTAIIDFSDSKITIDASCDALRCSLGKPELLSLVTLMQDLIPNHSKDTARDDPRAKALMATIRIATVTLQLDLSRGLSLESTPLSPTVSTSSSGFEIILDRPIISIGTESSLEIPDIHVKIAGEILLQRKVSTDLFGKIKLDSATGFHGIFDRIILQLHPRALATALDSGLDFLSEVSKVWRISVLKKPKTVDRRNVCAEVIFPYLELQLMDEARSMSAKFNDIVFKSTSSDQKTRFSTSFRIFDLFLGEQNIIQICTDNSSNMLDFTNIQQLPNQPVLEFIRYEDLFEHAERDRRSELSTFRALKQKAKDSSSSIIRASLDIIDINLEKSSIARCMAAYGAFIDLARHFYDRASQVAVLPSSTSTILIEIGSLVCNLDLGTESLRFSTKRNSLFVVSNMKNVDVAAIDLGDLTISAKARDNETLSICQPAIHLDTNPMSPLVLLRVRRNRAGRQAGKVMVRISLNDVQFGYYADMPWLSTLLAFKQEISAATNPRLSKSSLDCPIPTRFALDFSNVCVALHPYSGRSKALLCLRKSMVNGQIPVTSTSNPIQIHAGVIDLFLIDDTDSQLNHISVNRRLRNDVVASNLIRLGFVKVASVETVEISLRVLEILGRTCVSVSIVGAILTLSTCADSTATLLTLINLLRLPVVIGDELKYKLGVADDEQTPLDVFADIEDQAFHNPFAAKGRGNASEEYRHRSDGDASLMTPNLANQHFLSRSHPSSQSSTPQQVPFFSVTTHKCFVIWNLYDGYDWEVTRNTISQAVNHAIEKARRQGSKFNPSPHTHNAENDFEDDDELEEDDLSDSNEVGDLLFNSIFISLPDGSKAEDLTQAINQELAQADVSDTATQTTTTNFRKNPKIVPDSQPNTLQLGRSRTHKVRIEVSGMNVHCEFFSAAQGEIANQIRVAIAELEIMDNVSTSTWRKFLTFHREILTEPRRPMATVNFTSVRPVAGLAAAELAVEVAVNPLRLHVDQDTLEFLTRFFEFKDPDSSITPLSTEEIFIQRFEIHAIPIRIDYKPKRVNLKSLRSGRTTEFKNFFILEDSNMILKHVVLYGVCGFARIFQDLNDIWLAHIKSNQLGSVLAGVSPLRSLASFGDGIKNLVMLPISEYKKDGRVVPGLKKGLNSFVRSTGNEAVRLSAKLAVGTQGLLETAEQTLSQSSGQSEPAKVRHAVSMYADQPRDLRQGISQGIGGMSRNMMTAKNAFVSIPRDLEDETDARAAAKSAARTIPVAVLRPLIGTTEMISKTLLGLRNTMNPEQRKMNDDKYKHAE